MIDRIKDFNFKGYEIRINHTLYFTSINICRVYVMKGTIEWGVSIALPLRFNDSFKNLVKIGMDKVRRKHEQIHI